ncbi:hypothetical protein ANN_00707 [Periplaneta americana]|uniref:U1-type domain-containing protein n=1 Tax=Periplaneta americana TaxID=6978 RepID=A0ABQ8TRP8_PERAM|nr:hypothetical protein ANN_00707 [Periplaneta americana]
MVTKCPRTYHPLATHLLHMAESLKKVKDLELRWSLSIPLLYKITGAGFTVLCFCSWYLCYRNRSAGRYPKKPKTPPETPPQSSSSSASGSPRHSSRKATDGIHVADMTDKDSASSGDEKQTAGSDGKLLYNYVYYDPEMHWCRVCNVFPRTAKEYLNHLHSAEHKEETLERKLVDMPWHKIQADPEVPHITGAPAKRTPIRDVHNMLMSDEAHFHLSGYVNKQNFRYWSPTNPYEMHEEPLYSVKVTVWCAIASFGIIDSYFFEDNNGTSVTVTSQQFVRMFQQFLPPQIANNPLINRDT